MVRRQPTKHNTYYELLDAIRGAAGCPLCDIEANSVKRYFDSLLHESVNDPEVRAALIRSRGYCERHAHYLQTHGNGLGIAILYRDQIEHFLRSLDGLEAVSAKFRRKGTNAKWPRSDLCPACRTQNDSRNRHSSTLIEWIHDEEMRSTLDASRGFCVGHFLALLEMPMDAKARALLIETQRVRMMSLLHDLEEFCRKHDYQFSGEGFGSESNSWLRAIELMVGSGDRS